ncbi:hypothetical protein [Shewanella xiamenensis]|uniref:hypothetical protein n=1 Tax=Shewanella xiamenensis TaxID=332186 RepID=UPI0029498CE3|nr:hypothetical protein [Shewanella xiamenensis]MDV5248124.1 hypothetical protein [Shewanella xiamenensis]
MFKYLAISCSLLYSSSTLASNNLPQVLDYYPTCEYKNISTKNNHYTVEIDKNELLEIKYTDSTPFYSRYFEKVLKSIQQDALSEGADAIIIERITLRIISVKKIKNNEYIDKIKFITTTTNIKSCQNDIPPTTPTPYNSKGENIAKDKEIHLTTLAKNDYINIYKQAKNHLAPAANVTLNRAYGLSNGEPESSINQLMGPESVKLSMLDGSTAYVYGRTLWIYAKNSQIVRIDKNQSILNNHGSNMIEPSDNYDQDNWIIDGKIQFKDKLAQILSLEKIEQEGNDYRLDGKNNKLILYFETFSLNNKHETAEMLTGFSFVPRGNSGKRTSINFNEFDNNKIKQIISDKNEDEFILSPSQLANIIKIPNQVDSSRSEQWVIATENILLGINDIEARKVSKIRFTESLTRNQNNDEFMKTLKNYNIPITKSDFLSKNQESEDNFEQVFYRKGNVSLTATFESEDMNAQLIDLLIEL